jgi:hypothetical protein
MKNILSILVAVLGVVCIVFGVLFVMEAGSNKTTVVDELTASGVTVDNIDAKYDAAKAGLAQALAAGTAGTETSQSLGWQKVSLGLGKTNLAMVDFVQKSGILAVVLGAGFLLAGAGLMKKAN